MKNKTAIIILIIVMAFVLAACGCEHEWQDASCMVPRTCVLCGETEGDLAAHIWNDADCTTAKTCAVCAVTEGEALGHSWEDANCVEPKTCTVCNATEGDAAGHEWVEATCTMEKVCAKCDEKQGEALGHEVVEWKTTSEATCQECGTAAAECNRCGETIEKEIEKLPHTEGKWQVVTAATSSTDGLQQTVCKVCGTVVQEEKIVPTAEEREALYKKECAKLSYDTIARNPEKYKGEKGYVYGRVIQVIEDGNDYTLRVAMNGSYSAVILVSYTKPAEDDRILEDDYVRMYGEWYGTYTYEATSGASITVPLYYCKYLDIQ